MQEKLPNVGLLPSNNAATPSPKKAQTFCCQRLPCAVFHPAAHSSALGPPRTVEIVAPCFSSLQECLRDLWHPHQIPARQGIGGFGAQGGSTFLPTALLPRRTVKIINKEIKKNNYFLIWKL